jgi:hypothetical protein
MGTLLLAISGGGHADARLAPHTAVGMGHHRRALFAAHVNRLDPFP